MWDSSRMVFLYCLTLDEETDWLSRNVVKSYQRMPRNISEQQKLLKASVYAKE
jgi:hypothetical protein